LLWRGSPSGWMQRGRVGLPIESPRSAMGDSAPSVRAPARGGHPRPLCVPWRASAIETASVGLDGHLPSSELGRVGRPSRALRAALEAPLPATSLRGSSSLGRSGTASGSGRVRRGTACSGEEAWRSWRWR
jgi:hypothetical protein